MTAKPKPAPASAEATPPGATPGTVDPVVPPADAKPPEAATGSTLFPPLDEKQAPQAAGANGAGDIPPIVPGPEPAAPYGYRKDGSPAARRGPKVGRRMNPSPPGTPDITDTKSVVKAMDPQATALVMVDMTTGFAQQIGGPEWKPTDPERGMLIDATGRYLAAKGIPDIPPGWMLLAVISMYALPRLNSPTMKERLSRIGAKMRGRFSRAPMPTVQ